MTTERHYLDFDLEIGLGAGREYPVAVVRAPGGEAHALLRFPFDELALENSVLKLQNALLRSGGRHRIFLSPDEQAVQDFGRALFDALFTGEVRSRYDVSVERARREGRGLRLKLRVLPPELAALPWEFLYDPRRPEYVCLSTNTPVVPYLDLPQPPEPLAVTPPLRILAMVASPSDLPPLDTAREQQRMERALKGLQARGLLELRWLDGSTHYDLQRAMRAGPWHIFQFVGHGGFDRNSDEGFLALTDEDGDMHRLGATRLARLLADHYPLRLALLNACEGARGSQRDIFSSTAATLVRRGVPAVLAMQYAITDRAAIAFAHAFYDALADGLPVDAAVGEARKTVSTASNSFEWGVPVLYMRSPDGVLFNLQTIAEPARQARDREDRAGSERRDAEEAARLERERHAQATQEEAAHKAAAEATRRAQEQARRQQIDDLVAQLARAEAKSDWGQVIELGEQLLKLAPDHQPTRSKTAKAYHNRSVSYHKQGDYDRAIADDTRAIELDPKNAAYYDSRSVSYHQQDDYARAIADDTQAIELDANNAGYYYSRGVSYHGQGDRVAAHGDFEQAAKLGYAKAKNELAKL